MRNRYFLSLILVLCFIGCVKDEKEISNNQIFDVKVDSKKFDDAVFVADNFTRYTFEIQSLPGIDIDNDKQFTVAVSDGSVTAVSNPSSTTPSLQTNVTIQGGKASFYYLAGKKAQPSAILSISISGIVQTLSFEILPSEPDQLQISVSPANPHVNNTIDVTVYLLKDNPNSNLIASEGLRVDFEATAINPLDPIEPIPPSPAFSYSTFEGGFVVAKKTFATNNEKGKIQVTATYTKVDQTKKTVSRTVEFKP